MKKSISKCWTCGANLSGFSKDKLYNHRILHKRDKIIAEFPVLLEIDAQIARKYDGEIKILFKREDGTLLWKILAIEDERRWRIKSKTITQDEWLSMIEKILDRVVRNQVACIVWRDYADDEKAWLKFEHYLAGWKPNPRADKEQTRQALMDLGYPERLATEHVKVIK